MAVKKMFKAPVNMYIPIKNIITATNTAKIQANTSFITKPSFYTLKLKITLFLQVAMQLYL